MNPQTSLDDHDVARRARYRRDAFTAFVYLLVAASVGAELLLVVRLS